MKKISEIELMDYVDGTLDAAHLVQVEAYLSANAEDAELVANMKAAREVLHDLNDEPLQVSPNFWPELREKLGPAPRRNPLKRFGAGLGAWLWPAHSPAKMSLRAAVAVAAIALSAFFFAPKSAVQQPMAKDLNLTPEEKVFIQQSLNKHAAYAASQPAGGGLPVPAGDERSIEHGDSDDDAGHTP